MKLVWRMSALTALLFAINVPGTLAQDDEARQQSGLPTYIGNRRGSNPGNGQDARLSGSVEIEGMTEGEKSPRLSVAVLANGVLVARQQVKNRGAYSFTGIPRNGITLVVEIDNQEIGSYPVGTLTPPPMPNRKDIFLVWAQVNKASAEKLAILNAYPRSETNQRAFDKAISASKEKGNSNAVKLFKDIVEKDQMDFVAWTELGNLLFKEEKFDDADKAYEKALSLKPEFVPALLNSGKLNLSQKRFDPAIASLTRATELAPDSADVHHYLGEAFLQSKKGSKAVEHLNKAIELAPLEKAEIHLRLAMLYNAAGLKDRAAAEYKAFLLKVPDHPEKARFEKYISENQPK